MRRADYIIVGQGLCGTLLSLQLLSAAAEVVVIDEPLPFSAGKVASGLINPVTGMRVVKSWMIDDLLPVAAETYAALEKELQVTLMSHHSILEFHPTAEARDTFSERVPQYPEHLRSEIDEAPWRELFHFHYGIGEVKTSLIVHVKLLQEKWREHLKVLGALIEEKLDWAECSIHPDKAVYKDIEARKIIFCDGSAGLDNPYFSRLPFALNKGQVLLADIPGLPRQHIYRHGLKIAPWENDLFWVGSSFEWTYDNADPTTAFRTRTEQQLKNWLKLPFTITDHLASVRPATVGQKPFAGFHPLHPAIGIFNGMGAKGCSLAPYFARSLAQHILHGTALHPEADIARFIKILSK